MLPMWHLSRQTTGRPSPLKLFIYLVLAARLPAVCLHHSQVPSLPPSKNTHLNENNSLVPTFPEFPFSSKHLGAVFFFFSVQYRPIIKHQAETVSSPPRQS